eukprot:CAMPEP_0119009010 /NCGR_PEP_ID=MMETSP1176-20130426/4082_1 /TAXON_ID=265551 /ORGANISM="Synedropsis recta cf, Strain CCMP1620" /LENGTH=239 /DNA_ID=CAMNT_0006961437 /DNA_START=36 /DNA_END=755 /DNA_ORIENTATION=+
MAATHCINGLDSNLVGSSSTIGTTRMLDQHHSSTAVDACVQKVNTTKTDLGQVADGVCFQRCNNQNTFSTITTTKKQVVSNISALSHHTLHLSLRDDIGDSDDTTATGTNERRASSSFYSVPARATHQKEDKQWRDGASPFSSVTHQKKEAKWRAVGASPFSSNITEDHISMNRSRGGLKQRMMSANEELSTPKQEQEQRYWRTNSALLAESPSTSTSKRRWPLERTRSGYTVRVRQQY